MTHQSTDVLVIGAGPYGLSLGASLSAKKIDHLIVGHPMAFWEEHMPEAMCLRSDWDWHLDPGGTWTILRFMEKRGYSKDDLTPFPLNVYLDYVSWFQQNVGVDVVEGVVRRLDRSDADDRFVALLENETSIESRRVVLSLGFWSFQHIPEDLVAKLPSDGYQHTRDFVDFSEVRDKRYLIVGGRQSAFEWAALLADAGAATVHLSHRHPSPAFAHADWSWTLPIVEGMVANPSWYRDLSEREQQQVGDRLWQEGRLKVEYWLEESIKSGPVQIHAETSIVRADRRDGGEIEVELDSELALVVDDVVLATGYLPDIQRIPLLQAGNLLGDIDQIGRLPALDEGFQTSIPGLYATSMLAVGAFGPFFAFTLAARASAEIIGQALQAVSQT